MKKGIFAAAAVAALGFTMSASASTISYKIFDGSAQIGSGSSSSGSLINATGSDGNFFVSLNAVGPASMAPNFSTNDFSIAVSSLTTPSVLTIYVTNTGLTSAPTTVQSTFTTNALASSNEFTGDTIANYYDASNTAYGTASLLGSAAFTGAGGFAGPMSAFLSASGMYSETTIYTLNFATSTAADTVTASSQIVAATPEPNSLVLLGSGLFGAAGMVFKRRRNAAV